jgi:hypothetical protein
MFFKDSLSLLAECAAIDLSANTEMAVNESQIISAYSSIEEASEEVVYAPEMVPVVRVGNDLLTEMQYLAPYIQNNDISSVAEALDNIAEANNLPPKSIGLLVESQECVTDMIDQAIAKSDNAGKKMLGKVKKGEGLIEKLKKKGFTVKKKKRKKSVKEGCGDSKNECGDRRKSAKNEEGTNSGTDAPGDAVDDTSDVNNDGTTN